MCPIGSVSFLAVASWKNHWICNKHYLSETNEIEESINSLGIDDEFKSFEDEQELTAIISASELESRLNALKESGEIVNHEKEIQRYEEEQESKAIISYDELLIRANSGNISYESEENMDGIKVGKVDTSRIETFSEDNDKPYYKEESFLEAMKEFRRALWEVYVLKL